MFTHQSGGASSHTYTKRTSLRFSRCYITSLTSVSLFFSVLLFFSDVLVSDGISCGAHIKSFFEEVPDSSVVFTLKVLKIVKVILKQSNSSKKIFLEVVPGGERNFNTP